MSQISESTGREYADAAIPGQCVGPTAAVPLVVGNASRADVWLLDATAGGVAGPIVLPGLTALLCPACNRTATLLAHAGRASREEALIVRVYDVKKATYILERALDLDDIGRTIPVGFLPDDSLVLQSYTCLWKLEYPFDGTPKLVYSLRASRLPADIEKQATR